MKSIVLWFAILIAGFGFLSFASPRQAAAESATSFQQVSLGSIANYAYQNQYANPPVGDVVLEGIPFSIPAAGNALNTSLGTNYSQRVSTDVPNPRKIHILINSGNTWAPSAGSEIGSVQLDFADGTMSEIKLVIGQNIREWSPHWNTVNTVSDPGSRMVYSETWGYQNHIDLLSLDVPASQQSNTLTGVRVTDTYNTPVPGYSTNPAILWSGLTVEYSTVPVTLTPTPTQTPTPTPTAKLPVILIPGIMGSEFAVKDTIENSGIKECANPDQSAEYVYNQGDTIWFDSNRVFDYMLCGRYLDVLQLQSNGVTAVYPQIGLKGGLVQTVVAGEHLGYHDILQFFSDKGYELNKDFFIFPYDWRKDLKENITALDDKIASATATTGKTKVQIIAHSMGGLIARDYIRDPQYAQKVDTLIELGTPHAGTPTFLAHLLYNKCVTVFSVVCVVNGDEVNRLVQNFPGAFELLPSKLYYQLYPDTNDFPFNDSRDIDDNGVTGALDYTQTKAMVENLGKNMPLFARAEAYHDTLDASYVVHDALQTDTNGVKTYLIAGSGHHTLGQIREYKTLQMIGPVPTFVDKHDEVVTNGDGTVPVLSATLGKLSQVYYVNQAHNDLTSGTTLQLAYNLLTGQHVSLPGTQPVPYTFDGSIISVHSPVILHAYDAQGQHTGPKDDGTIEVGIPGSSYDTLGEAKFICLPNGGTYRIATKATGEGSFDLKIKTYTESTLTKEQLYLAVPQAKNTTTALTLDAENPLLHIDTDNNGTVDKEVSPSSTITGGALGDTDAPTTTVQTAGTSGTNDWYTSDVSLSFSAEDRGAGIYRTYYYKDDEQTLHEAAAPLTISSEGITKLWYFSVDKAGNTELPKSVLVKIDKTAPHITYISRTTANPKGWNNTDVTVNWVCEDSISGAVDPSISKTLQTEGENQSLTGTCRDTAGNTAEDTQSGISIDKTPPSLTIATPQVGQSYTLNSTASADWTVLDALSGIAAQYGTIPSGSPIETSKVGTHDITVTATDNAGNTTRETISYTVIYRFDGFLQPINDTGHEQTCGTSCTVSVFKSGSTVPVKFQLKDASGTLVQASNLPQWITPQKGNTIAEAINEADFTDPTDSGTIFTWNDTHYQYNWKTKDLSSGVYWLIGVKLDDGQTYTVNIGLR